MTVLNPFQRVDERIMDDADLAGPILFCLSFAMFLLFVSGHLLHTDQTCVMILMYHHSPAKPNSTTSTASASSAPSPSTPSSTSCPKPGSTSTEWSLSLGTASYPWLASAPSASCSHSSAFALYIPTWVLCLKPILELLLINMLPLSSAQWSRGLPPFFIIHRMVHIRCLGDLRRRAAHVRSAPLGGVSRWAAIRLFCITQRVQCRCWHDQMTSHSVVSGGGRGGDLMLRSMVDLRADVINLGIDTRGVEYLIQWRGIHHFNSL
jgi:hypothetical protein